MRERSIPSKAAALPPSAAIYSRLMLSIYDFYVLGISNRFAWRCPTPRILDLYQRAISDNHLDIGVGTGYYLDHVRFPSDHPTVDLMDINPMALARTAERIKRYQPRSILADVTRGQNLLEGMYDSIGINYLFHCLAGAIPDKGEAVLERLIPFLRPSGGRLFGATILGAGVHHNGVGRQLMTLYNQKGVFDNQSDSEEQLRRLFEANFERHEIEVIGCVAQFIGYR